MPVTMKFEGADVSCSWGGADISGSSRTIEIEEKAKSVDVSTRDDVLAKQAQKIAGLPEREVKLKGLDITGGAPAVKSIELGDENTVAVASGNGYSRSGLAVVTEKKYKAEHDGAAEYEITFEIKAGWAAAA